MTPALTYNELRELEPCSDSLARVAKLMGFAKKWDGKKINARQARKAGATFDDIVWAASATAIKNPDVKRRLRLWMSDCAAHILEIYEKQINDSRPRDAIVAPRRFARGEIETAAWASAGDSAWASAGDSAWAAAGDSAWAAEQKWQFDRLILWLSANEPDDYLLPKKGKPTEIAA